MKEPRWERQGYLAARRVRDALLGRAAALLAALGIPATAVSLAGPVAAATLFWSLPAHPGRALAGGAGALLADALDGVVARRRGSASGSGKLLDQVCDAATFALITLAVGLRGPARPAAAVAAAVFCSAAVAVALAVDRRRRPTAFRAAPHAGFWAHLPKLPAYLAIGLALTALVLAGSAAPPEGGLAAALDAALWLAAAGGAAATLLAVVSPPGDSDHY